MNGRRAAIVLLFALMPLPAAAQSGEPAGSQSDGTGQPGAGPMTIERIHSGVLLAPDFKITEIDGGTSELIGGYGGWVTDKTFFIGGAGYWLANGARDRRLAYGGLLLQWMGRGDRTLGYSIKGLVGGGESTLSRTITQPVRFPQVRLFDPRMPQPQVITTSIRSHQGFFVAEPELDVMVRITRSLHLTAGAGYRFIAAEHGNESRIRGAVGTVGLQLGGGY